MHVAANTCTTFMLWQNVTLTHTVRYTDNTYKALPLDSYNTTEHFVISSDSSSGTTYKHCYIDKHWNFPTMQRNNLMLI